jgi:hypothetical protein
MAMNIILPLIQVKTLLSGARGHPAGLATPPRPQIVYKSTDLLPIRRERRGRSGLDRAMPENAATKQPRRGPGRRFQPGQSGNPAGKRPGTRHRATMLAERLLDGEVEAMVRMVIEKAKQGDMVALRLCLDRIVPPRRDRPVNFTIPALKSAGDASKVMGAITTAVACGELTPAEAAELSRVIEAYVKAIETSEIERRLKTLEERQF